jgi:hypothetical protein
MSVSWRGSLIPSTSKIQIWVVPLLSDANAISPLPPPIGAGVDVCVGVGGTDVAVEVGAGGAVGVRVGVSVSVGDGVGVSTRMVIGELDDVGVGEELSGTMETGFELIGMSKARAC